MSDDPLDQLAAAEPVVAPPTRAASAQARQALLTHIASTEVETAAIRPKGAHRVGPVPASVARRPRRGRFAVLGVAAALAIGAVFGATHLRHSEEAEVVVVASPGAIRLELGSIADVDSLVSRLETQGEPFGDATIVRRIHGNGEAERRGVDVYADDGRYAYGATAETALDVLDQREIERLWPVSVEISEALAVVAEGDSSRRADGASLFVAELREASGAGGAATSAEIEVEAWAGVLRAVPLLPGSRQATIGAVGVLDGLAAVELRNAVLDERQVVVALRGGTAGSERLFFDAATGSPIRYDRVSAGGQVLARVVYDAERVELD